MLDRLCDALPEVVKQAVTGPRRVLHQLGLFSLQNYVNMPPGKFRDGIAKINFSPHLSSGLEALTLSTGDPPQLAIVLLQHGITRL